MSLEIILLVVSVTSGVVSFISVLFHHLERKKNNFKILNYEEQLHRMKAETQRYFDLSNDSSYIRRKGFSDEYEEYIYLLRRLGHEISGLKSDIRNVSKINSVNIDVETVADDIAKNISIDLIKHFNADDFSQLILHEISNCMSMDYFKELKKSNLENKTHDTYKTIQHIQHILRTPLSGLKINLNDLKEKQIYDDEEVRKVCLQMENAITMIESNMRTLTSYSIDENIKSEYSLKEQVDKYINLMLLTSDKKINLNINTIKDDILLPGYIVDDVILCISCLVENAISFASDNSEIVVECCKQKNGYLLSVINFGQIIKEEDASNIFEDGFSTRESTGIGLHLAKTIVHDKLNGNIFFENLEDKTGVNFSFTFEVI